MSRELRYDGICKSCFWDNRTTDQWELLYDWNEKNEHCSNCYTIHRDWEPQISILKKAILKIRREKDD